jgi:hypothetical protein
MDFEAGTLRIRRALQQGKWRHGRDPTDGCGMSAQMCPDRFGGGLIVGSPKSRRGSRVVVLAAPVLTAWRSHRSA